MKTYMLVMHTFLAAFETTQARRKDPLFRRARWHASDLEIYI